ncbi:unnamed protein product [Bursaphelenchus okinawaensis]|uniref:ANK_REP_REGION domain-containing protein n=1 Tax=Bursaphelenchus okinawaensis TaxID=465554 RepID=A0A811LQG2_9BILA|nr:unnamed protein product [Bursaphelenchus okinawaensis]CAG9126313.1 unnamed protein product [Bursaphelenchus okinawaensis]
MSVSIDKDTNSLIRCVVNPDRFDWEKRSVKDILCGLLDNYTSNDFQLLFLAVLAHDKVQPFQILLECNLIEKTEQNNECLLFKVIESKAFRCLKAFLKFIEPDSQSRSVLALHNNITSIHLAAQIGAPKLLKVLLEVVRDEISELMSDVYQRSPLHYAAISGSHQCVEECLDFGFAVDKKDKFHQTPLMFAVGKAHNNIIQLLVLKKPASVSVRNKFNGMSVLHLCILNNNIEGLKIILQYAPKQLLDQLDENTRTPLHYAALYNRKECAALLLNHGANKNVTDKNYAYPAHYAAQHSLATLKLLTAGVKDDLRDNKGRTTFMWAVLAQNNEIVKAYLNRELSITVDPNSHDMKKKTALHLAAQKGYLQICKQLINADPPWILEREDWNQATPVHLAAGGGHNHLLEFFRLSADIDLSNSSQVTPLFYACLGGMAHTVQVLVETYKANVNHKNNIDQTPLHCAVFANSLPCVEVLIKLQANRFMVDFNRRTPVELAEQLNHKLISDYLAS